jgi:acyl-CoA synthetase (AMP-forming)/AMP-acid ligase II
MPPDTGPLVPSGNPLDPVCLDDLLAGDDDRPAVLFKGQTLTRSQLRLQGAQAAAVLNALGLRRGDALALWIPNGPAWLQLLLAAARLGLLVVPISTRYRAPEVLHLLKVSRARAIVTPAVFLDQDYAAVAASLRDEAPDLQHHLVLEQVEGFLAHPLARSAVVPPQWGQAQDLLVCFSTSGTTGAPKLAAHDHRSTPRHAAQVARALELHANDVLLCTLPLFGVFGFMAALAPLSVGAPVVLHQVFEARSAAEAIQTHRVTHFIGSDGMLDDLLRQEGLDLTSLRRGALADFSGLIAPVIERADALGARFSGTYGMSEVFSLLALAEWEAPVSIRAQAGGRVIDPVIEVRVADPETHQPLAAGQTGEIQMRGPNVLATYLNNPEATARAFTPDGWFRSGDLGLCQPWGFTYLARMGDSLRLRGYLVNPSEIESVLMRDPGVGGAQVVGVQRPGQGDVAIGFVIPAPGADPDRKPTEAALLALCRERMASYKVPSRILTLEHFPVINGPNGVKIQKRILRDWAAHLLDTGRLPS